MELVLQPVMDLQCLKSVRRYDSLEKLKYDLYYIKNMSLLFDVNIILRTVAVILRGQGAR